MYVRHLVLAAASLALVSSSAIPMWEFLTRGEKMSHLFNMFVKQVADHCDTSNMPDCQKVLLVYGLTNLAKMEDDSLDKMDPYQRGANDIIWESMMHGSYKKKTEQHRNYYNEALEPTTSEGNQLGSQEEASSKVESYTGSRYMLGPMVVRVRPDGSPVPEEGPLPKDEDKEEFQVMRARPVPSLEDLKAGKHESLGSTQGKRYSSIADILSSQPIEASTYKPNRPFTGFEDLLATRRPFGQIKYPRSEFFLTPPPGYVHHESLSEIEEKFAAEQKKKDEKNKENSQPHEESSGSKRVEDEVVARHVSSSVSALRNSRHI